MTVGGLPIRVLRFSPWRGWDFSSRENSSDNDAYIELTRLALTEPRNVI